MLTPLTLKWSRKIPSEAGWYYRAWHLGIELNPEYAAMARDRVASVTGCLEGLEIA